MDPQLVADTPQMVANTRCEVGEGPLWHPLQRCVFWVDIPRGRIHRYDPVSGQHEVHFETDQKIGEIGGFTIQESGALLLFMSRGTVAELDSGRLRFLLEEVPDETETRFNDVAADPAGRVFCGTMPAPGRLGRLYRLETDGSIHRVLGGIGISNGIGFSPDKRRMYHVDSEVRQVYSFQYDEGSGLITHRQVLVETPEGEGLPDGMTVDAEGFVWVAKWDGSALCRYTPDGTLERSIEFPALKVTSVIFGGEDLTDIYVTTAGGNDRASEGTGAGALFRLNLGIQGLPEPASRIAG